MSAGKKMLTKTDMALQYFLKFFSVRYNESTFCGFELLNPYIWTDGASLIVN